MFIQDQQVIAVFPGMHPTRERLEPEEVLDTPVLQDFLVMRPTPERRDLLERRVRRELQDLRQIQEPPDPSD